MSRRAWIGIAVLVGLVWLGLRDRQSSSDSPAADSKAASQPAESLEPDEPCETSGPMKDNPNIKVWCTGGIFTKVHATSDGNNWVTTLQFSKKGYAVYARMRRKITDQFENMANEMVEKARLNAAFSFHDPSGQLIGGCFRRINERAATCR